MPRVTESLRTQWRDQREQMLEERAHSRNVLMLDFDIHVMDKLLSLKIGAKFDAQEIQKELLAESSAALRELAASTPAPAPTFDGSEGASNPQFVAEAFVELFDSVEAYVEDACDISNAQARYLLSLFSDAYKAANIVLDEYED